MLPYSFIIASLYLSSKFICIHKWIYLFQDLMFVLIILFTSFIYFFLSLDDFCLFIYLWIWRLLDYIIIWLHAYKLLVVVSLKYMPYISRLDLIRDLGWNFFQWATFRIERIIIFEITFISAKAAVLDFPHFMSFQL